MPYGGRYARRARGMRLYGALAVLRRSRGGEGDMRADGARRDRGEIGEKACKSTIKKDDMTKFFLKKMQKK